MASIFQGTPQTAPSYAATITDVPKWLQDYTVDLFSQQRAVSGAPYTPYELPRIAQTTAPTTAAYDLIQKNIGAYQPAMGGAVAGSQGLAGATSVGNINAYMNPYTQNVTDQIARLGTRNLSENLLPAVSDQFIRAGQFGSSGMGTFGGRALRDTQEAILAQQAGALQSGYTQALGASATDLARQQQAQQQVGELAKMQQGLTTADAAALESIGTQQQAQQQKGLDVAYQDFLAQRGYPQEQINAMSTTLRGLPPGTVPTSVNESKLVTTPGTSPLADIAAAYGVYRGLTKAKGGLVDGYADGGLANGDDLEQSVMADYGQYFNNGGEVKGYGFGGRATATATADPNYVPTWSPSGGRFAKVFRNMASNGMFKDAIAPSMASVAALPQDAERGFMTNALVNLVAENPQVFSTPSEPIVIPRVISPKNLEELNARYYTGGHPYGRYLGQGYADGGRAPGYANEGYVDVQDPAALVPTPNFTARPVQQIEPTGGGYTAPPVSTGDAGLMSLLTKYSTGDDYSKELAAARDERKASQLSFDTALGKMMEGADAGPSKSEMYFRLAAAFANPGKTGSFMEGMGRAAGTLAEVGGERRAAETAKRKLGTEVALKRQELALESAKDQERTLLGLQSESNKERRAFIAATVKEYIDSGKPASEAGRIAKDMGFKVGTQEYQAEVDKQATMLIEKQMSAIKAQLLSGNVALAGLGLQQQKFAHETTQLEPGELKIVMDNETGKQAAQTTIKNIDAALKYVDQAFTGTRTDKATFKTLRETRPDDPRVFATEQLENLLGANVLSSLKTTFGGAGITDSERRSLADLQGLGSATAAGRRQILMTARKALEESAKNRDAINYKVMSGGYRKDTKPVEAKGK